MVVSLGEVLQRPAKGFFTTVHVEGEVYGEIELGFAEEYKSELGRFWRICDKDGFQLRVEFNNDDEDPKITDGWMTLREHYRFEVTFNLTMTEDPKVNPVLTLPEDMGAYLWHTM
ncbi:hypothetical protein P8452_22131 [Trifolium repens]|nr:hypothetical protein P8452_22131 [Trifolium repens]